MKPLQIIMLAVAAFVFSGCGRHSPARSDGGEAAEPIYQDKIIIGTETWPGYLALYVAEEKGFFEAEGLDIELRRYVALGELSNDYMAGKMQGRANLTLDAVNELLQGLDHRIVLAIDYSSGSDAIAAGPEIKSVRDFAGKRVAYEPGTLEEFFLNWALRHSDMTIEDIEPVHGNPEQTAEMLQNGEVDVAVTHEPFLTMVIASKKAHVVYSSAEAPGLITDVLTFRSDFVEQQPETIKAIARSYFLALDFCKQNPDEANAILAQEFDVTADEIAQQLKGVTLLDLRDNRDAFSFAAGLNSLYVNTRRIHEFVQESRGESKPKTLPRTDDLIEPRFIRELSLDTAP